MKRRILVVAREAERRATLARSLIAAGYSVELAEEPKRARAVARSGNVALALMEPDGFGAAGPDLARQLHETVGELIVAERPDENAEDIVVRINAALEPARTDPTARASEVLLFDGWTLDVPARSLRRGDGPEVSLTRSEFELLLAFLRNPGWVLSRDQLRNAVAGRGAEPYERSIDMLVGRLRRKLEPDPKVPRFILTVPGAGYKFAIKPQRFEAGHPAEGAVTRDAPSKPVAPPIDSERHQVLDQVRAAERRQVTILSCELALSGPRSIGLDPEDLQSAINTWSLHCAALVARFGGTVVHHLGHRLLASFGYPQAHEDDAEQAVRAGLALAASGPPMAAIGVGAQTCVGIATGMVVIGALLAKGSGQDEGILGEAPKLAEALQTMAEPGRVVIAPSTRRLAGGLFQYRELEPVTIKAFPESLQASRVVGPSGVESRFEARQERSATPLVGREEEMELLLRRWRQATQGDGRVVLLTGEAGIGKSRLTAALSERVAGEPHVAIRYFCSPRHVDSTFFPIIAQLERAAGFERTDPATQKLSKLERLLEQAGGCDQETIAVLADLLSLPGSVPQTVPELSPQKRKEKMLSTLLLLLGRLTEQPKLLIFEDVHWIDPTSLELLSLAVERATRLPVLLVVTARPEFAPSWGSEAHATTLTLTRLNRDNATAMVEQITGGRALPADVMSEIVARADGVPLFVEELTKSALESGLLEPGANASSRGTPPAAWRIPSSLHDSLMARLDRLGSARGIAQIGAALGREFSRELISAVASISTEQLQSSLDRLVGAGLIHQRGTPPHEEYAFKHALVQDAAHGSLLRRERQKLHALIATTLEDKFLEVAMAQPERLALHYAEAGNTEKAAAYRLKAGLRALSRSAMAEAVAQLRNGLSLLSALPNSASRQQLELDLQLALARAMMATKGYAAEAVGEAYGRARELCTGLERSQQFVTVLYGQCLHHLVRAELQAARRCADEMLHLAETRNDPALKVIAWRFAGIIAFSFGEFAEARAHFEHCLRNFDPAHRPFFATLAIDDIQINLLAYLSLPLLCLGHLDEARASIFRALEEARRLSHSYSLVHTLVLACLGDWLVGDWHTLLRRAQETVALSGRHGFSLFGAWGETLQGCALASLGKAEEGLPLLNRSLTATRATGTTLHLPHSISLLAYAFGQAQQPQEGLKKLAEALEIIDATEDRWGEAEVHRLKGELLIAAQNRPAAEDSFLMALSVATRQGSKLWELRAAISLARLWHDQGKRGEARDLLAPIYRWFESGHDIPCLHQARVLLSIL